MTGDHGSTITSYHIEIDDGNGGDFRELQGLTLDSLALTGMLDVNVLSGVYYRFKYRAKNEIGYGPFSDITYILTASIPEVPEIISTTIVGSEVIISW